MGVSIVTSISVNHGLQHWRPFAKQVSNTGAVHLQKEELK